MFPRNIAGTCAAVNLGATQPQVGAYMTYPTGRDRDMGPAVRYDIGHGLPVPGVPGFLHFSRLTRIASGPVGTSLPPGGSTLTAIASAVRTSRPRTCK